MKWAVGALFVLGLMVFDHYRPLPLRKCEVTYVIDTPERAKEYAFAYWRANESRVKFGSKRYRTADDIVDGINVDGKLEVFSRWKLSNIGYQWFVGGEILKFSPEYYGFGLTFNRCGRVLEHEKVGHG